MLLTEEQADVRLNSASNLINRFGSHHDRVKTTTPRRQPGHTHRLPQGYKAVIADAVSDGATVTEVAEKFGVSPSTVSAVKEDLTENIHHEAMSKMLQTLGLMTADKIAALDADKQAGVLANLGRVVEKTMPRQADERLQIHIHVPAQKKVADYEIVDVLRKK